MLLHSLCPGLTLFDGETHPLSELHSYFAIHRERYFRSLAASADRFSRQRNKAKGEERVGRRSAPANPLSSL